MTWLLSILGWLTKGPMARVLDTIDRNVDAGVERDRLRAQTVQTYISHQASWLRAGGMITLLLFAVPAALWRGSVYIYSMLWCSVCAWPQDWAVGDIPLAFREVDLWIVLASIGALGLMSRR